MFSGFWSWLLVVIIVVAIFSADRLPELKKYLETLSKEGVDAAKKGSKTMQEKIAKVKAEKAVKKEKDTTEE